jgi:uncharacterized RDD family membrane protein YckC
VAGGASAASATVGDVNVTGRRVVATLVDFILLSILAWVMSLLFGTTQAGGGTVSFSLTGLPALLFFLIFLLYYIILEGTVGQTVGKMLLGIQVVREGTGQTPGLGAATIRTLLRIIDGFFFYLVALIVVLVSGKNQRLGDMVANTLVVRKGTQQSRVA